MEAEELVLIQILFLAEEGNHLGGEQLGPIPKSKAGVDVRPLFHLCHGGSLEWRVSPTTGLIFILPRWGKCSGDIGYTKPWPVLT